MTHAGTAIEARFAEVGVHSRDVDLQIAAARYRNNGGTLYRAIALVRAAFEANGGYEIGRRVDDEAGQRCIAARADNCSAPASSSPVAGAGHRMSAASNADVPVSPASAPIPAPKSKAHYFTGGVGHNSGGGQIVVTAHPDKHRAPSPEPIHVREHERRNPGYAKRGMDAIASVQGTIARSLFDTYTIDGLPIGDLTFGEARRLGRKHGESHYVLAAICAHVRADDSVSIRDGIKEDDLRGFISDARRDADVF